MPPSLDSLHKSTHPSYYLRQYVQARFIIVDLLGVFTSTKIAIANKNNIAPM